MHWMLRSAPVLLTAMLVAPLPAAAIVLQSYASCQATNGPPDQETGGPIAACESEGFVPVGMTVEPTRAAGLGANLGLTVQSNVDVLNGGTALGSMVITFDKYVFQIAVLPVPVTSIPLIFESDFAFSPSGLPRATGELFLGSHQTNFSGQPVVIVQDTLDLDAMSPPPFSTFDLPFDYFVGQVLPDVTLTVGSTSQTSASGGTGSSASSLQVSVVDLVLDQDEFDQRMGPDTFPLDQYFMILPEPTGGMLMTSGVLGVALAGRRRSRRSRRLRGPGADSQRKAC